MTHSITLLSAAAILAVSLSGPAFSQGASQTATLMKIDPMILATSYRTSKLVTSTVVIEANETAGTIDGLIVIPNESIPIAVVSVGGFLSMGARYVILTHRSIKVKDKRTLLRGATEDSPKSLPVFKYNIRTTEGRRPTVPKPVATDCGCNANRSVAFPNAPNLTENCPSAHLSNV